MSLHVVPWPHAPAHQLGSAGTYFVTASTLHQMHHFRGRERLAVLHRGILKVAAEFGWRLEVWAVFSNHYHFVAQSPELEEDARRLSRMLGPLHEQTAKWVNRLGSMPERQIWFNFRETTLTYEKSCLARLNYTHQNAVKHRLVPVANQYPWCSARWFERTARPVQVNTIYRLKVDRLSVRITLRYRRTGDRRARSREQSGVALRLPPQSKNRRFISPRLFVFRHRPIQSIGLLDEAVHRYLQGRDMSL